MIVKDEEGMLAQCLDSIKAIADEIIVVDTGSTDSTIEIAKKYTPFVYEHEWEGSFSKARNISIDYASMDWIMWIDADEELEQADIPILQNAMDSNEFDTIACWMLSKHGDGIAAHPLNKIFRRGKGRFEGIVHNQAVIEGKGVMTPARIYHYGYDLRRDRMEKKWKRSEALLEKAIGANPTGGANWCNLIRNYRARGEYEKIIETCKQFDSWLLKDMQWQMIKTDLAVAYQAIGNVDKSVLTFNELLGRFTKNVDGHFLYAELLRQTDRHNEAIPHYEAYISALQKAKRGERFDPVIIDTWGATNKALWGMAECYKRVGDKFKMIAAARTYMLERVENDLNQVMKLVLGAEGVNDE